jgi:hypothetical protein
MNKYQEALLELGKYTVVLSWSKNQTCSIAELNEFKLLQELVDKETPKEGIIDDVYEDGSFGCSCPNCRMYLPSYKTNRCSSCGQALKWNETMCIMSRRN